MDLLSSVLGKHKRVQMVDTEQGLTTPLEVISYSFDEAESDSPEITVRLMYRLPVFDSTVMAVDKYKRVRLLSSVGDEEWTERMRLKIWDGKYPTTVAIDEDTKEVLLVRITDHIVSFETFGQLTEDQYNVILEDLDDREPFRLFLDSTAMFKFIDGAEGLNHLLNGVFVEFNCAVPIRVYRNTI